MKERFTDMYKKKDRRALYITIAAISAVILLLVVLGIINRQRRNRQPEETTDITATHEILIYKAVGGNIEFDETYLVEENDEEVHLKAKEDEMVTMLVTPLSGRTFTDLKINDASNITREENYLVNDAAGNSKRINFVMPHTDIIMNFTFSRIRETEKQTEKIQEETQEAQPPYGLRLHGLTAEIIASYSGMFDDRVFLQALGDDLRIDAPDSEYHNVRDVTFSEEKYEGEEESDKVFHYIYFNHDKEWKVLASYYKHENAFVFTKPQEETELQTEPQTQPAADTTAGTGSPGGYTGGNSGGYSGASSVSTETSFDIMQVSTVFLKYVGGEEPFYGKTFEYILSKGLTGQIVGTMSSYRIDPENKTAQFRITLSSGGAIEGTYDRAKNSFRFSGL